MIRKPSFDSQSGNMQAKIEKRTAHAGNIFTTNDVMAKQLHLIFDDSEYKFAVYFLPIIT